MYVQSCSFFNSNAVPLKLALVNSDPLGEEINVMFKVGGWDTLILDQHSYFKHTWDIFSADLGPVLPCKLLNLY